MQLTPPAYLNVSDSYFCYHCRPLQDSAVEVDQSGLYNFAVSSEVVCPVVCQAALRRGRWP